MTRFSKDDIDVTEGYYRIIFGFLFGAVVMLVSEVHRYFALNIRDTTRKLETTQYHDIYDPESFVFILSACSQFALGVFVVMAIARARRVE
jgi:hypothetical protein